MIQHSHAYVPSVGASCFYCKNPTWKVTSQEVRTGVPRTTNPTPSLSLCIQCRCTEQEGEQRPSGLDWGWGVKRAHNQPPANLPYPASGSQS